MSKRETIEEFLKRGGTITKVDAQPTPEEEQKVMPTTPGGGVMTLADGSLYYAQIKPPKVRKKKAAEINVSALPPSLLKYVKNLPKKEESDEAVSAREG